LKKILIIAMIATQPVAGQAQNAVVQWSALSGGFTAEAAQSGRMLTMSAGQAFVEVSSNPNHIVESGFLVHPLLRGILVSVPQQEELPQAFSLDQNYPNPFNPVTTIEYGLPRTAHVELKVYSILGQEVKTLVDEIQDPGHQRVTFDAGNLATGVYLYRLQAAGFVETKKLMVMK